MTELKTLKDLKCIKEDEYSCCKGDKSKHERGECGKHDTGPWTKDSDLKQEAINRIKYYSPTIKNFFIGISEITGKVIRHNKGDDLDSIQKLNMGAIIELIEFFNITEEDLK